MTGQPSSECQFVVGCGCLRLRPDVQYFFLVTLTGDLLQRWHEEGPLTCSVRGSNGARHASRDCTGNDLFGQSRDMYAHLSNWLLEFHKLNVQSNTIYSSKFINSSEFSFLLHVASQSIYEFKGVQIVISSHFICSLDADS